MFQSTLPRGERQVRTEQTFLFSMFQSTLPRGERPLQADKSEPSGLFQSTLPRGERHRASCQASRPQCFNPRSRVGSDVNMSFMLDPISLFQSTLPRGERLNQVQALFQLLVFQSTLPRGERHPLLSSFIFIK